MRIVIRDTGITAATTNLPIDPSACETVDNHQKTRTGINIPKMRSARAPFQRDLTVIFQDGRHLRKCNLRCFKTKRCRNRTLWTCDSAKNRIGDNRRDSDAARTFFDKRLAQTYKSRLARDKVRPRVPSRHNSGRTPRTIILRTAPHADWLSTFIAVEKRP